MKKAILVGLALSISAVACGPDDGGDGSNNGGDTGPPEMSDYLGAWKATSDSTTRLECGAWSDENEVRDANYFIVIRPGENADYLINDADSNGCWWPANFDDGKVVMAQDDFTCTGLVKVNENLQIAEATTSEFEARLEDGQLVMHWVEQFSAENASGDPVECEATSDMTFDPTEPASASDFAGEWEGIEGDVSSHITMCDGEVSGQGAVFDATLSMSEGTSADLSATLPGNCSYDANIFDNVGVALAGQTCNRTITYDGVEQDVEMRMRDGFWALDDRNRIVRAAYVIDLTLEDSNGDQLECSVHEQIPYRRPQ